MPKLRRSSFDLPKYPIEPGTDKRAMEMVKRETRSERVNTAIKRIGATVLAATVYTGMLVGNDIACGIQEGKDAVRDDHAQIHEIYQNPETNPIYAHHGTFVLTGLGTKDPSVTAETLTAHKEVGNVFALEYSNKDLNMTDMAKRVIAEAKQEGLREISFDGYSAGGPIALYIAAYIHQHEPGIRVVSVRLNSSPIGEGSLTARSENGIRIMNRILSFYPDFVYYERGRIGVEVMARSDRYLKEVGHTGEQGFKAHDMHHYSLDGVLYEIDFDKLMHEVRDVQDKMKNPDVASANLTKHQADSITRIDYDNNIRILSKQRIGNRGDAVPLIIYTRSYHADSDPVVNIDKSEQNILESLKHHGNPYRILWENVGHANPTERTPEYQRMIHEKINPLVTNRLILRVLQRQLQGSSQSDSTSNQSDRASGN